MPKQNRTTTLLRTPQVPVVSPLSASVPEVPFYDGKKFNVPIRRGGQLFFSEVRFAQKTDITHIKSWRMPRSRDNSPPKQEFVDILEYAKLTGKFWRVYEDSNNCVESIEQLKGIIKEQHAKADLYFVLLLATEGKIRGVMAVRRSWKNTLKIEYLYTNLFLREKNAEIKGVGTGLLQTIAFIGTYLTSPMIWGECSEISAGFYKNLGFDFFEEIFYLKDNKFHTFPSKQPRT